MSRGKRHGLRPVDAAIEPDSRLLALDGEINRLVLQIELLDARRRRADDAVERDRLARRIRTHQKKIAKLYSSISYTEPVSLIGAATLLRRVPAMLNDGADDDGPMSIASRMVGSALVVVERSAE